MFIFIDVPILNCFFLPYKYPLEKETHASMLIDMGFDILEISERLGHESVKTTLDTYSHLYPEKDTKLAGELNKLRRPETGKG